MNFTETPLLPENLIATIQKNPFALASIPKAERTPELCLAAIKKNQLTLKFVPEKHKTKKLISEIKDIKSAIKFIPHRLKTYKMCLNAVKKNQYALLYVPRKHKTLEMFFTALFEGHCDKRYIPKILYDGFSLKTGRNIKFDWLYRKEDWRKSSVISIDSSGKSIYFDSYVAGYFFGDEWTKEHLVCEYRIILDTDNKVIWIGYVDDSDCFLSDNNKIYNFYYDHKSLHFLPDITSDDVYISDCKETINGKIDMQ
jgi:hypothetical protein